MGEWKNWLNADYAFSNNGEKIKKVVKVAYTINLASLFVVAAIGIIGFFISIAEGTSLEHIWPVPFAIALVVLLAPYLVYWSLSFLYGFGELVSNSYGKNEKKEMSRKENLYIKKTIKHNNKNANKHSHNFAEDHSSQKRCPSCGNWTEVADSKCRICGCSFD